MSARSRPTIEVRFSEVISGLSYALDIVEGQPEGHALRSCMIGMRLADELHLDAADRSALFYALLLKDLGCSSNAAKVCYLFGSDDRDAKRDLKTTDWTRLTASIRYVARNVAAKGSLRSKLLRFAAIAKGGRAEAREQFELRCDRGASIARDLGLPTATSDAIRALDEHWDGRGHPAGSRGEEIPLLGRILNIAQTVEVFVAQDGVAAACAMARDRSGRWFDPALVSALNAIESDHAFWSTVASDDVRRHVRNLEPADDVQHADDERLDRIARAFAQVIDAKSPWTFLHSQGVSEIAAGIATQLGLDERSIVTLRRAGWLHDIGKLGVSNMILDKPGRLTDAEMDDMRLHPAYTLRILERVTCFCGFADLAASHHERLDGTGYHRGLDASQLSPSARALVVADMYEALSAQRPYRDDLSQEQVFEILRGQVRSGICPDAFAGLTAFVDATNYQPYRVAA